MADKKLNEVTTVNSGTLANVKNFLAVMKDGSIQQMSKEDMASVVGGLIGEATFDKNGLLKAGVFYKHVKYGLEPKAKYTLPDVRVTNFTGFIFFGNVGVTTTKWTYHLVGDADGSPTLTKIGGNPSYDTAQNNISISIEGNNIVFINNGTRGVSLSVVILNVAAMGY